ncbi:glycoside hydrolase family 95 protein [Amniculicola lignicola CBS 123094]|uniref:Glycoside hydrolase family 95 protein n=1 Tax=Amniculicola lignicola CBS 123094 TaxID=1392246 RepID=A0A6A5W3C5_9PLEO|nr:glycoside hydrolase family 95 protein [Amniculicola lignicola CBS 123094]
MPGARSIFAILAFPSAYAQWDPSRYLYFTTAGNSLSSSLPLGNGRLGAAVYGSAIEKVSLNENSVWSGSWQDRGNVNSKDALSSIRQKLQNGDLSGAGKQVLDTMSGVPTSPKQYHPTVDMEIDFGHISLDNYMRVLDTSQGTGWVTYTAGGVNYTRKYVASYPAGVLAFRMTSAPVRKLNATISLSRKQGVQSHSASISGDNSITLKVNKGSIAFTSEARVVNDKGSVASDGTSITVSDATTIDIFFDTETSYRYSSQSAREAELKKKLDNAVEAGYLAVRTAAVTDASAILGRMNLDLGSSGAAGNEPIPTRLSNYKKNANAGPELVVLYFNYGRHLLLASSRDTGDRSLPANLQGLWNDQYSPPWQSKYTININTEMNYWPALITNLAETNKALFDLIDTARPRGAAMAQKMYGCDNGFVIHHNTDLWGDAAPVDKGTPYMMWPMGGAWLSQHLMEHYRFTQDKAFLQHRAWPVLKQAADFYYCYLFMYDGHYVTGPSLSPENTYIVPSNMKTAGRQEGIDIAPAIDNQLLWELFTNIIDAAKILGIMGTDLTNAQNYLSKIKAPQVGSKGQTLEWRNEYKESEPGHRHMSPLFVQNLSRCFESTHRWRMRAGSGSTGWSRVWAMNLYARLFEGATIWSHAETFLQTYPLENLFNSGENRWFQIDGNFGFTSAIAEMLLQSHSVVHILPALPASAVPNGSVKGLFARGNFVVDIEWSGGSMTGATVTARSGGQLALRVENGADFEVNGKAYTAPINTTAGVKYDITKK